MIRKIRFYLFSPFIKNENEIQSLNGVRAVAILLVIVYHVWLPFGVAGFPEIFRNVFSNFNSGVDLFFVLSGFLIYSGILKYRKEPKAFSKRNFFLARSLRIFPAYYFCLFVLYLYFQGLHDRLATIATPNELQTAELNQLSEILQSAYADVFYISNYTKHRLSLVGWSLSIEEQFYLILPFFSTFFLFRFGSKVRILILSILYFVPLVFRIAYVLNDAELSVLIYSHTRMDSLLIGMILAEWKTTTDATSENTTSSNNQNATILGGSMQIPFFRKRFADSILFALGIGILAIGHAFPLENWFRKIVGYNCFNLGYAVLIYLSLQKESLIGRLFGLGFFRPIARLSYTMYLWNILIAGLAVSKVLSGITQPGPKDFAAAIGTAILYCFAVSWVLYLVVERPFLILKERILPKNETR
ncbi:acyltransferase [Leptospira yasudae]|uniref:acyltransferase family protein n=1 Tax=Leptospira yasudae TaxID=2202201 RepID=UPI0010828021|nr:acyltransferase [Leptospira yasudae]TGK30463.1 acyltransferase [Leptospira yasudae]TGM04158.1 acyltransferase [Leptospira yasudae]